MLRSQIRRLRRGIRLLKCRLSTGGIILGYHRVARCERDPWRLCVRGDHLAAHLCLLRERFHPLPLSELASAHTQALGTRPPVALTFDDAYVDVLERGLPILERFEFPATVFVVTGAIGEPYWWDRLGALLEMARPARVDVRLPGHSSRLARVRLDTDRPIPERVHRVLRSVAPPARSAFLRDLASTLGVENPEWRTPAPRQMDREALGRLADHPLITLGAHTRTHVDLANCDANAVGEEVRGSKADLEAVIGREVKTFAYPHGEVSARARSAVAAAGFSVACAGAEGRVDHRSDPLLLPRLWPEDVGSDDFRSFLRNWTGA